MRVLGLRKTSLLGLLIAPLFLALGINIFIAPNLLAFGGVSGASVVLQDATGIPIYVISLLLNLSILLIGWLCKGREFFIKTIIPSLLIPFYIYLTTPLQNLLPGVVISVIYGSLLMGISIGIVLALGGSTAGPDTIGEIIEDRLRIPAKYIRIAIDSMVILSGMYLFGFEAALYSLIVLFLLHEVVERTRKFVNEKNVFRY